MRGADRLLPSRPALTLAECRVAPIGEVFGCRQASKRPLDRALQSFRRQAGGQRINRFDPADFIGIFKFDDMIGMGHLRVAVIAFDAATDHPGGPGWKHLREIIAAGVEKHQIQPAAGVMASDSVRLPPIGWRLVRVDGHRQRANLSVGRLGNRWRVPAVDQASR